ncbi:MAG: bacillithiol biosynthesis cysteine-adding enzyme BshC, partial [Flavobacteriaceae bacterium]|nr:bacillithiol biosynthesis cysteine-adding enzyme BshC [Flavobacteriaceae bacterium]
MPSDCLSFRDTNYFSTLICDYLEERTELQSLYNRFPKLENFKAQIDEKSGNFDLANRQVLEQVLLKQYSDIDATLETHQNIISLKAENTFTITTGHQLNLFTGPLYFLYKIISTINLTRALKKEFPKFNFVPIYWMATEDHDFEEINYFNFKGKKVQWSRASKGPVGRMDLSGLEEVSSVFASQLGSSTNSNELKELFKTAYTEHNTLSEATLYLANELFGDHGLVILDADHKALKQLFASQMKSELLDQDAFHKVNEANAEIGKLNYKVQVNPREINLFYFLNGSRERILNNDGQFLVNNSDQKWTEPEILKELNDHPERFSPNVIMRPLYQETILPNLCYIGGGGELAYWLQLKAYFKSNGICFPILLLRNSAVLVTSKQSEKMIKLDLSFHDLFQTQNKLINDQTKKLSEINIDFSEQKTHLTEQFKALYKLAEATDKSFLGAVAAQE